MTSFRSPLLAKIHIARKDLGLDEDTYRAVLIRITGKRSAKSQWEITATVLLFVCRCDSPTGDS